METNGCASVREIKVFNLPLKRIEEKTEEAKPEMIPLPEEGKEQPEMIPETNV